MTLEGSGELRGGSPVGRVPVDRERVRKVAGGVKDPEVRTSIADLGLLDEVEVVLTDHFMAEALHRLINEGDRFAETRGVMRR